MNEKNNIAGTIVGVTTPVEFYFKVQPNAVKLHDIVYVEVEEAEATDGASPKSRRVWARVTEIERLNPLFPEEAAQELANRSLDAVQTIISLSREMITAKALVLGVEDPERGTLSPLTYPPQPASSVKLPETDEIKKIIQRNVPPHRLIELGYLRGREKYPVHVDILPILTRHLAVLATTGAGKTVTVRTFLEKLLSQTSYPVLILDLHSDYIGLETHPNIRGRVKFFYPSVDIATDSFERLLDLARELSGEDITPPQEALFRDLIKLVQDEWVADKEKGKWKEDGFIHNKVEPQFEKRIEHLLYPYTHFYCLAELLDKIGSVKDNLPSSYPALKNQTQSYSPLRRVLSKAGRAYKRAKEAAKRVLASSKASSITSKNVAELIQKRQVSILQLEGYGGYAPALVAGLLEALFEKRVNNEISQFLLVVEEAHNFIPSRSEGKEAATAPILRQIASEGRKYGMGLVLVSQRPSRLDPTALAQCNSYFILRIINPADQKYIREVVEALSEEELKILPTLATGEALIAGECVPFPMIISVHQSATHGKHEKEDFLNEFLVLQGRLI
ncbi:MAG: ATP-binding protein [Nitrososphaerota archaeon]